MSVSPSLSVEDADAIMAQHFPAGLGGKRTKVPVEEVFLSVEPIGPRDIIAMQRHVDSGASLGVQPVNIKQIRHTHHRLAQMLAVGVDENVAGKLCNYSVSRVSQLKADPAFAELLAHYSHENTEAWADFVGTAANLSMDFLQELQKRLDENPEAFTVQTLNESLKILADRTGHAPVAKSVNINVNTGIGDKLRLARERAAQVYLSSPEGKE